MTRARAVLICAALAALAPGCVGYRTYHDLDADRYDEVLSATAPNVRQKTVRYTVNVRRYVAGELAEPVSRKNEVLEELARRAISDMGFFAPQNVGKNIKRPDYHFVFNVEIKKTKEYGLLSGLILPSFRSREYTVALQVLDETGAPFASYAAGAETFQARHPFVILFTPFYLPYWADRRARRNVFEALAVKLIKDRKEYL